MNTAVRVDRCVFCIKKGEIYEIRSEKVIISQCSNCEKVWVTYLGKLVIEGNLQLLPRRGYPLEGIEDKYSHLKVCPECSSLYDLNPDTWMLECPEPLCQFTRPMIGNSPKYRAAKKNHRELKAVIFKKLQEGEEVSEREQEELQVLRRSIQDLEEREGIDTEVDV